MDMRKHILISCNLYVIFREITSVAVSPTHSRSGGFPSSSVPSNDGKIIIRSLKRRRILKNPLVHISAFALSPSSSLLLILLLSPTVLNHRKFLPHSPTTCG